MIFCYDSIVVYYSGNQFVICCVRFHVLGEEVNFELLSSSALFPGWIHAVFTHVDTLVFGGNFLHSLSIGLQLE